MSILDIISIFMLHEYVYTTNNLLPSPKVKSEQDKVDKIMVIIH